MDSVKYTEDQQKVIDLRDRNILVSAAAGSGKTAVLTERIVSLLKDKEKQTDIDKLLIVTFTNAAAAEMREHGSPLCLTEPHISRRLCLSATQAAPARLTAFGASLQVSATPFSAHGLHGRCLPAEQEMFLPA